MRALLSRSIKPDLKAIADYIAEDNPLRAESLVLEIWEKIRLIGENPLLYQLRPDIGDDARMAVLGRYVILFRIAGEMVRIERVVYGGRDLSEILH